jgi:hypothetical protein
MQMIKLMIRENQLLSTLRDGSGGSVKVLTLRILRHRCAKALLSLMLSKCELLSVTITLNKLREALRNGIRIS